MEESPPKAQTLGRCTLVVDEIAEEVCDLPGEGEVLVRNRFGLFAVLLCTCHLEKHVAFYAEVRKNSPRRRNGSRREGSQTRGSRNGTTRFESPKNGQEKL